jgi:hypothetical protein
MDKVGTLSRAIIMKEMGRLGGGDRNAALESLRRFLTRVLAT